MNSARTQTLLIRTPEGIDFSLVLAGPITRFLAWAVDLGCVIALTMVAGIGLQILGVIIPDLAAGFTFLAYLGLQIGYGIVLEWSWRGQTVGKRLLRLRVMDAQGLRLQPSQIAIRNLLRFVDLLPALYLVGGLACLVNRRAQRLGDLAANTIVVATPTLREPDFDQLPAPKYNSLRACPHLAARLQQRVPPAEAAAALQGLLRRDRLDPAARVELFRDMAGHFRQLVEFPAEVVEGLADEQYVRNVTDLLFRPRVRPNALSRKDSQSVAR